jgi:hypothetical protein
MSNYPKIQGCGAWWFERLTTNGSNSFALSLSTGLT